jgi:hypothetical protein
MLGYCTNDMWDNGHCPPPPLSPSPPSLSLTLSDFPRTPILSTRETPTDDASALECLVLTFTSSTCGLGGSQGHELADAGARRKEVRETSVAVS